MTRLKKRKFYDSTYVPRENRKAAILACITLWSLIFFFVITKFILGTVDIVGHSMLPTLKDQERYVINRIAYNFQPPDRNDIVAVVSISDHELIVKRVVGLPHDRIRFDGDRLWVNDRLFKEAYASSPFSGSDAEQIWDLREKEYFVLGDNMNHSEDSRSFGPVPEEYIVGRIVLRWKLFDGF